MQPHDQTHPTQASNKTGTRAKGNRRMQLMFAIIVVALAVAYAFVLW